MTRPLNESPPHGGPRLVPEDLAATLRSDGFTLGDWRVEPRRNRIVHVTGRTRSLDPRLIDVLIALASQPGAVLTRDELMVRVWQDTFVSENSLSQAVSRLRRALEDDRNEPRYIETIAKSGYRLLAEVRWHGSAARPLAAEPAVEVTTPASGNRRLRLPVALGVIALVAIVVALVRLGPGVTGTGGSAAFRVQPELTLVGKTFGPRISPDGLNLAFAWQGPAQDGDFDIWIKPVGGDAPVQWTDHTDEERLATWSPDGREIAFVRFNEQAGQCGIYRKAVLGGSAEQLADCMPGMRSLDWSPDGRSLAHNGIEQGDESALGLFVLEIETGDRRRLTTPPEDSGDHDPRFSPDGTRLTFVRKHGRFRHDVMVVPIDGGPAKALTAHRWGQIRGVDWSATEDTVLFSSNRAGRYALWSVSTAGDSPPVRMPVEDTWVTQPDVAREGGQLIYRTFRDSVDLWELPLDADGSASGEPIKRVSSTRTERQPAWSPDGKRIAFISDRGGTNELWSASVDGSDPIRHTDFAGPIPSSPAWSPDGGSLAFGVAVDGHSDIWVVGRESRRPRRSVDWSSHEQNPSFSRDGRSIYFASDRSGAWEIWRRPTDGGEAQVVTSGGGFAAQESTDGTELFFARVEEPGIWRMPVGGGEAALVVGEIELFDWGSWAVAERGIYYLRRGPTRVEYLPFGGTEPRLVHAPPKQMPLLGRALSYSAAHQALLFSLIDHSDDEVMLVVPAESMASF